VACSCEEAFVGSNAEAVNLGVGVLNGSRADAGQRFPEAVAEQVSIRYARSYRIERLGA
jgi:hypothetical protein